PSRTTRRYSRRGAKSRPRRERGAGPRRAAARSRREVAPAQRLLDADVGRTLGHGERPLAGLAAAAAHLVPAEVAGDALDSVERLEEVPCEHHVLDQLCRMAVAAHAPLGCREGGVLELRLTGEAP